MLLEARNIKFSYEKSTPVLDGVSLRIDPGERVALVGPSGCGKSTLSLILSGYLKPQYGEVLFDKRPLPHKGYCPVQLIYQHPEKAFNPRMKMRGALAESWMPDAGLLDEIGIAAKWLDRYPSELSGGELQRFCVARALGPKTRFIIADEMSAMLDAITQAQIWGLMLRRIKRHGMGLLAVTHSPELAERICTRIIFFDQFNTTQ